MFSIGSLVQWSSSANRTTSIKKGVVEAVIAPKCYPTDAQRKEADAYGMARDHESYLVRVPGKTVKAKGKLYWPRVSGLSVIDSLS